MIIKEKWVSVKMFTKENVIISFSKSPEILVGSSGANAYQNSYEKLFISLLLFFKYVIMYLK